MPQWNSIQERDQVVEMGQGLTKTLLCKRDLLLRGVTASLALLERRPDFDFAAI